MRISDWSSDVCSADLLAEDQVYGVKTPSYIVREQGPSVTAWTLLMSMQTGQPLLLCAAAELTTARRAATTAVAVDALADRTSVVEGTIVSVSVNHGGTRIIHK